MLRTVFALSCPSESVFRLLVGMRNASISFSMVIQVICKYSDTVSLQGEV